MVTHSIISLDSEYHRRKDEACRIYSMHFMDRRTYILARTCLGVSTLFHLLIAPVDYFFGMQSYQNEVTLFHVVMLIVSLSLNYFYQQITRTKIDFQILNNIYGIVGLLSYTLITREVILQEPHLVPRYALIFALVNFFIVVFNTCLQGFMRHILDICAVASVFVAFGEADDRMMICLIVFLTVCNTIRLRILFWRFVLRDLKKDFDRQCTLAPQHMILRASEKKVDLGVMLAPKERIVCCISSDWRNYTYLSSRKNPMEMGSILKTYYDSCLMLLDSLLPDSIYFTDWIADELFIAILADSSEQERLLVNRSLNFAFQLLLLKEKFLEEYGAPTSIDVGVSFGSSYAGIIGPKSSQKATAIGEIPCRARRLQMVGKFIRQSLGEADRVLFGRESLMKVTENWNVNTYDLSKSHHFQDVSDSELFYIDKYARNGQESTDNLEQSGVGSFLGLKAAS